MTSDSTQTIYRGGLTASDFVIKVKLVKTKILTLLLLLSALCLLPAQTSRAYLVSDQLWQNIDMLCRVSGVTGPSSASPVPEAELRRALERVDPAKLYGYFRTMYDETKEQLEPDYTFKGKDGFGVELELSAAFETYLYTEDTYRQEFFVPYKDMEMPIKLGFEADFSSYASLFFEYGVGNTITQMDTSADDLALGYNFANHTNLDWVMWRSPYGDWSFFGSSDSDNAEDIVPSIQEWEPMRVGASFGNGHVHFLIGRTRQSMGHGATGNFILGDNFPYQEAMQLKLMSDIFSYTFSYTHYDTQLNPYDYYSGGSSKEDYAFAKFWFNTDEHSIMVMHRFDVRLGNHFRFVFNEGGIFSLENPLDPRLLIPAMFVHAFNDKDDSTVLKDWDEANNIMGFELEWAPLPGWLFTSQIVIDQFQLPGEKGDVPSGWGAMVNGFWTKGVHYGYFDSWAEAVYTSPYLYLNEKYNDEEKTEENYNYDYIVGYFLQKASEIGYAGYFYGPDSIVFNVGTKFTMPEVFAASVSLLYKVHGERGINYGYNDNQKYTFNGWENAWSPTGTPEHLVQLMLGGEKYFPYNLTIRAELALLCWANYNNEEGDSKCSLQSVLGISWEF